MATAANDKPVARGAARRLILDTAEQLFAERGVDGVSLRTINAAAGVSPGVLHYHFGSREVLVHELINRHMEKLMIERARLLQPLTQQQQPLVRDIVHSLVHPLAQLAFLGNGKPAPAGARYVRFIARLDADKSTMLEEVSQRYQATQSLYPTLLQKALPGVDATTLALRLAMAHHAMLQVLSDLTSAAQPWPSGALHNVDNTQLTAMLIDFMSSGIRGDSQ
jgi:AcrR family transcriptional regulator